MEASGGAGVCSSTSGGERWRWFVVEVVLSGGSGGNWFEVVPSVGSCG